MWAEHFFLGRTIIISSSIIQQSISALQRLWAADGVWASQYCSVCFRFLLLVHFPLLTPSAPLPSGWTVCHLSGLVFFCQFGGRTYCNDHPFPVISPIIGVCLVFSDQFTGFSSMFISLIVHPPEYRNSSILITHFNYTNILVLLCWFCNAYNHVLILSVPPFTVFPPFLHLPRVPFPSPYISSLIFRSSFKMLLDAKGNV